MPCHNDSGVGLGAEGLEKPPAAKLIVRVRGDQQSIPCLEARSAS